MRTGWLFALVVTMNGTGVHGAQLTEELYDCLIEPERVVELSFAVDGVLASVEVDRGDRVGPGQVLARLDSRVEEAAVAVVRARAGQNSEIELREAELALARRKANRIENLFRNKNASAQERDEARARIDMARAKLGRAREEARLARLELDRAQAALARRVLVSPMAGVVTEQHRDEGEYVEKAPVLTLARIDPLRVEALLPARVFGRVSAGQPADVILYEGEPVYRAEVQRVDPVLDTASGTFGVRLRLPNPEGSIPSGLECRLRFIVAP